MFRRSFSFWRGLVGATPGPTTQPQPENEDRRIWVRYPAQLETTVTSSHCPNQERHPAIIEDISQGGARFGIRQPLTEGVMITLDLPTVNGVESVLACVVRVSPMNSGSWDVGCVFSQELTRDELHAMGASDQTTTNGDQRKWVRYSCPVRAKLQRIDHEETPSPNAEVLNLSANGVGLLVDEEIETGTLLNVELWNDAEDAKQTILACVVHVSQKEADRWALGCNFIRELSEQDLVALT